MSISRQQVGRFLYEFEEEYQVTYVNFSRANELADAQLIMTLERGCERQTFAFSQPHFNDIEKKSNYLERRLCGESEKLSAISSSSRGR
jgi:hypothetical protein